MTKQLLLFYVAVDKKQQYKTITKYGRISLRTNVSIGQR